MLQINLNRLPSISWSVDRVWQVAVEVCPASFRVLFCVWWSDADTHFWLFNRVKFVLIISKLDVCFSATFLIVDPLQFCICCISLGSNLLHSLCGALPVHFLLVLVTPGSFVAHCYSYALLVARTVPQDCAIPRCTVPQDCVLPRCTVLQDFSPHSVSLWSDLVDCLFNGVGLTYFKNRANSSLLTWAALPFCIPQLSLSSVLLWVGFVGLESSNW